ncbi:MAG: sulfatase-like hydrolase/transferase [Gammaproteobacteria bacterium]
MRIKRGYRIAIFVITLLILISILGTIFYKKMHSSINNMPQYNIILIINDQEVYHLAAAKDYTLPAREELASHGITFSNHYTAAAMCSPSRATLLTGVPPQVHGVFDQEEYSYVPDLDPKRPNMGSVLKQLGYRTVYYGKFEMNKKLLATSETENYSTLAQQYGFDSFNYDGDVGGEPLQGYTRDPYFVGEAIRWLRKNADAKDQPPFFMVISLLNPHDIMYGDANLPNTPQIQVAALPVIFSPPANTIYQKKWKFALPASLDESLVAKGVPDALNQYQQGWSGTLGFIPTDRKDMWQYYYNYYLNLLQDNDRNLHLVIDTLNQMKLWQNTVVILTSDHGEMGGAHGGLRGKGPMMYEENTHIPLIIAHPKASQGSTSSVLTSHIDMLPTLVGLTGLAGEKTQQIKRIFPGHDFSSVLLHPGKGCVNAIRKGILFNYVGISTITGKYLRDTLVASFSHKSLPPLSQANYNARGFLTFVFNGRYKFGRYYSPNNVNTPKTLDEIITNNDVQLFDLKKDPDERNNLALQPEKNKDLILKMNSLLNELIAKEVGKNSIAFLPAQSN